MKDVLNLIQEGQLGLNKGIKSGYDRLDDFTSNLQMESIEVIGAGPKTGKTAFIDDRYILKPYLLNPSEDIHWIYFSFEISRMKKTIKWICWFLYHKYGIVVSPDEILSRGSHKLSKDLQVKIESVLEEYITPLLGKYDEDGMLLKEGKIDFHERKIVPTGIYKYITNYFESIGEYKERIIYTEVDGKKVEKKVKAFKLNEKYKHRKTIILVDHIALVAKEERFTKKENIDKLSEYFVEIRNKFKPLIIITQQFNRDLSKIDRLKFSGVELKPTKEDFKESGNTAEDCNKLYALFKPSIYPHIDSYLGDTDKRWKIKSMGKNDLFLHLLESRDTEGFIDLGCCMYGAPGYIKELPKLADMNEDIYNKIKNKTY